MTWLHRYAQLLVAATLALIAVGGMVTSTHSGLSVPDWPTTYGYNMFTFPFAQMVGGIFYEHGHRLIASGVGVLTIGLVLFQWRREGRAWARRLGWIALIAVILQGTLGGLTVIYLLPDAISISHAGLAQIFFCLTVTIAVVTSSGWLTGAGDMPAAGPFGPRFAMLTALVYAQILLGASMRHTGAGLAIPDFPWAFGRVVPPFWNTGIALHYAHRLGALTVLAASIALIVGLVRAVGPSHRAARAALLLLALVATQVTLGSYVVITGKQPLINTAHVAVGASVLATSLVVALRCFRSGRRA